MQVQHHRRAAALGLVAVFAALLGAAGCGSSSSDSSTTTGKGSAVFMSSQASELTEAQGLRNEVLKGAPLSVKFIPVAEGTTPIIDRLTAEAKSGRGKVDVAGALHGDFVSMLPKEVLTDVSDVAAQLQDAGIPKSLMDLGKLGTDKQYYIPWSQATYLMVANKKALPYLPTGADVNNLTYDQLTQWAANLKAKTGQAKLGFPASGSGLIKRFLEGYLVPAFSGGVVTTFKSPEAVSGWNYLRGLWKYLTPQSLTYDFMADALQSEEVWVAWDHVARIQAVLQARPNDFVVFPGPIGPKGRAFMPVVSGFAIPKSAPDPVQAKSLIKYLLSPRAQANTLGATGFFPVVSGASTTALPPGLSAEAKAVALQSSSSGAVESLLPVGLGETSDDFDKVYVDAFRQIVVKGQDPTKVLAGQARELQGIMDEAGAPCWRPDPPSQGPCQVK